MKNSICDLKFDKCTGCFACYSKCSHGAIEMKMDQEGFFYPFIDEYKCVSCGACKSSCPPLSGLKSSPEIAIHYGNAKDLIKRKEGSSGGVFGLLAETVIAMGGVVYGAVYSAKEKLIVHSNTDKVNIERIYKSKYVQSRIGDCFKEIKAYLENDKMVLFCGTPCQVAGLNHYLGKKYVKLITTDFMCHGVPSSGLFADMIKSMEEQKGCLIKDITFRDKVNGWRKSTTTTTYMNDDIESVFNRESVYYQLFLNNYSLRRSCYECGFYNHHESDITLADYWNVSTELDDDTGVSLVFINSDQGKKWFDFIDSLMNHSEYEKEFDFDFYRHGYPQRGRKKFFADYTTLGYKITMEKWSKDAYTKDIPLSLKLNSTVNTIIKTLRKAVYINEK